MLRHVLAGKSELLEFEVSGLKGGRRWLETQAGPLLDAAARVEALICITRDVTERKRTEAQIQGQLEELQRWREVTLGREDRVLSLKEEVNALLKELGRPPRYSSAASDRDGRIIADKRRVAPICTPSVSATKPSRCRERTSTATIDVWPRSFVVPRKRGETVCEGLQSLLRGERSSFTWNIHAAPATKTGGPVERDALEDRRWRGAVSAFGHHRAARDGSNIYGNRIDWMRLTAHRRAWRRLEQYAHRHIGQMRSASRKH